jgi:PAS domain S-box-containing protein
VTLEKGAYSGAMATFVPRAAGSSVAAIGLMALAGWLLNISLLTAWKSGTVPMAPLSAVLSICLGVAVGLSTSGHRWMRLAAGALSGTIVILSTLLFTLRLLGVFLPIEQLGLGISGTLRGAPLGYTAAFMAFYYSMASAVLLLWRSRGGDKLWVRRLTGLAGALTSCGGLAGLVAGICGIPLLYLGTLAPPSLNASLVLIIVGLAIVWLAGHPARGPHAPGFGRDDLRFIVIFAIVATVTVIGGATYYRYAEARIREQAEQELGSISNLKVGELRLWRAERLGDASVLLHNTLLSTAVAETLRRPGDGATARALQQWLSSYETHGQYDCAYLFDAEGRVLFSEPALAGLPSAAIMRAAADTIRTHAVQLLDFYRDEHDQRIYLATLAPVLDESSASRAIGAVALRIDPTPFLRPFIEDWPGRSKSAETVLVRRDGSDVLFLNNLRFDPYAALRRRIPLTDTASLSVQAVLGRRGVSEGLDYRGVEALGVLLAVPDSPWFLSTRLDTDELYAQLWTQFGLVVGFVGLVLLSTGTGLAFVWRTQRARLDGKRADLALALQESEQRLRHLLTSSSTITYSLRSAGGRLVPVEVSENVTRVLGYTPAEALQPDWWINHVHAEDLTHVVAGMAAMRTIGEFTFEYRFLRKDGVVLWIQDRLNVLQLKAGGPAEATASWNDITTHRQAEDALRDNEERLRLAISTASQSLYDVNLRTGETIVSPEYPVMLGYDPAGFQASVAEWTGRLHPDDREPALAMLANCLSGPDNIHSGEYRLRTSSGTWKWIRSAGKVVARAADGTPLRLIGIHTDIDASKTAELQAQRLARLYAALSRSNEAIVRAKSEAELFPKICEAAVMQGGMAMAWIGLIDQASHAVIPVASYGQGTDYLDGIRISVDGDDPFGLGPTGRTIRENCPVWIDDFSHDPTTALWHERSKPYGWVASAALPLTRGGRPVGIMMIYARHADAFDDEVRTLLVEMATNISYALDNFALESRRTEAETRLHESEQRYRTLFADSNMPMLLIEPASLRIADANQSACAFYGWTLSTLRQMTIFDINTLSRNELARVIAEIETGRRRHFDFRHRLAGGEVRDVEVFTSGITVNSQSLILSEIVDVTSRKRAEKALLDKEHLLSEAQRIAQVGSWSDDGHNPPTWSDEMFRLWGLPVHPSAPPFETVVAMVHPDDRATLQHENERNWNGEPTTDIGFRVVRPTGEVRHVISRAELKYDNNQRPFVTGTVQDITDRKAAEDALRASLAEKEALLKEVHHRVKNNMQVITSLLRLEAGRTVETRVRTVLAEMQNRIRSMALLHETLYRSGNLAQIDLAAYITQLAKQLFRSVGPASNGIALNLSVAPAHVSLDQAIPCGLLVNELVSNSLKHGFPDGRTGEIWINVHPMGDGPRLRIEVRDTGIGLPADFDQRCTESLGMHLVAALARQLHGTFEVGPGPGAAFSLVFSQRPSTREER